MFKEKFMKEAIKEAEIAFNKGEIPIGSVIVLNNKIVSKAHNRSTENVLYHSEILCINKAISKLKTNYLNKCSIYITMEPCPMCLHALSLIKIKDIYFGAYRVQKCNYPDAYGGFEEKECSVLVKNFFNKVRKTNKRWAKETNSPLSRKKFL